MSYSTDVMSAADFLRPAVPLAGRGAAAESNHTRSMATGADLEDTRLDFSRTGEFLRSRFVTTTNT